MNGCPTPWKIAYESRDVAKRIAKAGNKSSTPRQGQLSAYRCPGADHWHLTHMAASVRKRIKRQQRRRAE